MCRVYGRWLLLASADRACYWWCTLEYIEIGDGSSIPHKRDLSAAVSYIPNGRHSAHQSFKFEGIVRKSAIVYVRLDGGHAEKGIGDQNTDLNSTWEQEI